MQQGRTSPRRRASSEPDSLAAQSRLVVAGITTLLMGVACLILGVFASLGSQASPASAVDAEPAKAGEPLVKDPLINGKSVSATSAPLVPVERVVITPRRMTVIRPSSDSPSMDVNRTPTESAPMQDQEQTPMEGQEQAPMQGQETPVQGQAQEPVQGQAPVEGQEQALEQEQGQGQVPPGSVPAQAQVPGQLPSAQGQPRLYYPIPARGPAALCQKIVYNF